MIKPSAKIYRKQIIEGYSIPAIIKNGSYFFVDLSVYENGRVECWNFEDFEHFKNDVNRGWVVLSIPENNQISIHGLGNWTIENGKWLFNKDSFIKYVENLIKELNPNFENIYKYTQKTINGIRFGESGRGVIYKEVKKYPEDVFPEKLNGQSVNLFYKAFDIFHLVKANVFSDNTIQLSRMETPVELTLDEFEKLIQEQTILTEIPENANVNIYGLGSFTATKVIYATRIKDKFLEIQDIMRDLNGQPSTLDVCKKDHQNYLENPTVANKEKLRKSYENVPDHQKMYVGDMDTKDIEVRMIIYGEQEIEHWSHYQVAKTLGHELPTIQIPKPKDENK